MNRGQVTVTLGDIDKVFLFLVCFTLERKTLKVMLAAKKGFSLHNSGTRML